MVRKILYIKENISLEKLANKDLISFPQKVSINNQLALLRYVGESGAELLLRTRRVKKPAIGYIRLENYKVVSTSVLIDGITSLDKITTLSFEERLKDNKFY